MASTHRHYRGAMSATPPPPDAVSQLLAATTTVGEHYYAAAGGLGLTVQEARLLFVLASNPSTMLGLTAALRVPKSTMTGLITRMESAGLVERSRDPSDGRAMVATPTDRGRDVSARFARDLAERVGGVLAALDETERTELAGILSELLVAVEPR